jgi:hypothetical protein
VKYLDCILLFVLFGALAATSQSRPRPPGLQQAEQAEAQADKSLPPPGPPQTRLDLAKIRQDADELARIAQTIPLDVASMQKGLLPQDMVEKLKRIEKLAKQLRGKLTQ